MLQRLKAIYRAFFNKGAYRKWVRAGRPVPTPHAVKEMIIREFALSHGIRVFIETGTYLGDMVAAARGLFHTIYSVELSEELYEKARERFARDPRIHLLRGDSSKVLGRILHEIREPCLFWLDSHFSEGATARGEKETPITEELDQILSHPGEDHLILIDDARLFTGERDYPALAELERRLLARYRGHVFEVKDDIIRCYKRP